MKAPVIILGLCFAGCMHEPKPDRSISNYTFPDLEPLPSQIIPSKSIMDEHDAPKILIDHVEDFYCGDSLMIGSFLIGNFPLPNNKWLLPIEPLSVLEPSYLKASSVEACILVPNVHVEDYPIGEFGDYVREGYLAKEKGESRDENDIRGAFFALAKALVKSDEDMFLEIDETRESLQRYIKEMDLKPEIYFAFLGKDSLSIAIDPHKNMAVVRHADSVGIYNVLPDSVPSLELFCHTAAIQSNPQN